MKRRNLCFSLCLLLASAISLSPVEGQKRKQVKPAPVTLEVQLAKLAALGFKLEDGINLYDILDSFDRKEYEKEPYDLILSVLGTELQREPWGRWICPRVWNFDTECIVETGDYVRVVKRLCQVAGRPDCLTDVSDFVDIQSGKAWLKYKLDGRERNWRAKVEDDWIDMAVLATVMKDIERDGHRFYAKNEGQSMVLFYLDSRKAADLNRLTNNALKPVVQVDSSTNDEYEVLSALLNEIYLTGDYKSIVVTTPACCEVQDGYVRSDSFKMYLDQLENVSFETLDDYAARNQQSLTFEKKFKLKTTYKIVPYPEVEKIFPQGMPEEGWKLFYSKYPAANGYIRLSRVGFNKARDQAIVNTNWMRGPLHGNGSYVLLGKQNGSWKVLKNVTTWIS